MKIKDIIKLHKLVIHKRSGTNKQYFKESKEISKIRDNSVLLGICRKCFKDPR